MSRLDDLTKSLVDVYASQLNKEEQDTLLECLEILANDQKYNKFNNYYPDEGEYRRELYPKHISFFKAGAEWKERAFLAANRVGKCITVSCNIELADGSTKTVKELYESQEKFHVWAWNGKEKVRAIAGPIFKKEGLHSCAKVTMSDGRWFEAADYHRILDSQGVWRFLCDMLPDAFHYCKVLQKDAPHLSGTGQDCLCGCLMDFRLCGEQLLSCQDNDQYASPLQADVRKHTSALLHLDGLGNKYNGNSQQFFCRPSIQDAIPHVLGQLCDSSAQDALLSSELSFCSSENKQLNLSASYQNHTFAETCHNQFLNEVAYTSPFSIESNHIVAANPIGCQEVYDFEVEVYHNYFMSGILHHNSEAGAFETTCHATGLYPSWWEGKRFDRPVLIWVGGDTATTCRDIIQKKLIGDDILDMGSGMIPKDTIIQEKCKTRRNVPDAMEILKIRHITGGESTIVIKTYEQGRATWQGTEVDFCIAEDSPVLMAEGYYKKIQDIVAGEYVMSVDKNRKLVSRKVVAVYDKGIKDTIEVSMKNGIWLKATPDHKVYDSVKNKHELQDVKRILQADLTQLTGGHSSCYPKVFYRLLGLYLAEGTFATRKITIGNEALMEDIISELPIEARIRKFTFNEKHNHVPDWTIYWDEFWSVIHKAVSSTKEIPDFVFCAAKDEIKEVIRYMYAGDGWASGKAIGYASTSRVLTEQLSLLLARFGIRGNIIKKSKQNEKWNDQWWLLISASEMVKLFCEEIGIPYKDEAIAKVLLEAERRIASKSKRASHYKKDSVKHNRAYMKSRNIFQKYGYSAVRKIENADARHVYDLSVEGEHRFIVGTHVVSNCWVDEECPQDVYGEALIRLMTTKGSIITTFTPLNGITPLVLSFLDNSQETNVEFPRWVEICTWDDVPHLSEEEKAKTLANTPPQLRDARSKGIPTVGSGLIYPIEQKQITVADFQIPRHFQKLYGMDVGWKATAACWGAWDRENDVIYIYSEYKRGGEEGLDMPLVHASTIKSRGEWIKGTIDPASRGRTQTDGEQLYMTYKKHGLKIYPAQNAVESGIFKVWERLNSGRLKIFSSCTMLLRELSLYHRDDNGKIVKKNDHLADCLRYLCTAESSMWSFPQQDNKQSKVIEMSRYMQACT